MVDARPARLFTTAGIDSKLDARKRATEALMATVAMVPPLSARLLGAVGVKVDNRTEIEALLDAPVGNGSRPPIADAALVARTRRGVATAVFVIRVGDERFSVAALKKIREAAGRAGIEALVTVGNDAEGPDLGRSRSKVEVQHWSWASVLTALVDEKLRDAEQKHVLGDLIEFLRHPDARVVSFGDMGPSWASVLKTARTSRLSERDSGVVDVCRRWDQVVAHVGGQLASRIRRDVQQVMSTAEARNAERRLEGVVDRAAASGQLEGVYSISEAAGDLAVVADLTGRRLVSVVSVEPPANLGARATVGWLLDSLTGAPGDAVIEAWQRRGRQPLAVARLDDLERDMSLLIDDRGRAGDSYRVLLAAEMPTARTTSGRNGGFVDGVTELVDRTWEVVLGPLSGEGVPRRSPRPSGRRTTTTTTTSDRRTSTSSRGRSGSGTRTSSSQSRRRTTTKKSSSTSRSGSSKSSSNRTSSSRSASSRSSSTRKSPADLAKELRREG